MKIYIICVQERIVFLSPLRSARIAYSSNTYIIYIFFKISNSSLRYKKKSLRLFSLSFWYSFITHKMKKKTSNSFLSTSNIRSYEEKK